MGIRHPHIPCTPSFFSFISGLQFTVCNDQGTKKSQFIWKIFFCTIALSVLSLETFLSPTSAHCAYITSIGFVVTEPSTFTSSTPFPSFSPTLLHTLMNSGYLGASLPLRVFNNVDNGCVTCFSKGISYLLVSIYFRHYPFRSRFTKTFPLFGAICPIHSKIIFYLSLQWFLPSLSNVGVRAYLYEYAFSPFILIPY